MNDGNGDDSRNDLRAVSGHPDAGCSSAYIE